MHDTSEVVGSIDIWFLKIFTSCLLACDRVFTAKSGFRHCSDTMRQTLGSALEKEKFFCLVMKKMLKSLLSEVDQELSVLAYETERVKVKKEILQEIRDMKVENDTDLAELIEWVKKNRHYVKGNGLTEEGKKFMKMVKNKGKKQGSATRFWGVQAPTKPAKRREMLKQCPGCFLKPNAKVPGYPICSEFVFDTNKTDRCQVSCKGVKAAQIRSQQYKDREVQALADAIEKAKCTNKK